MIEANSLTSAAQYRIHPQKNWIIQVKLGPSAHFKPHSIWYDAEGLTGAEWAQGMLLRLEEMCAQEEDDHA